ncbi:hypothetical protein BUH_4319 [Burkholderia pseudomallei Pakistan 9]|nr:hypothetical protein BUH_4319 [Burkholderia pseudomallei Pakistan 9]
MRWVLSDSARSVTALGAHVDNFQSMQPLFRAKQVKLPLVI